MIRTILVLTTMFVAAIFLIRVQAYDDRPLRNILDADCTEPCFMNIHPGQTTSEEALTILNEHEWVAVVYQSANGHVTWEWTGSQPAIFKTEDEGRIVMRDEVVQSIIVPTRAHFWEFLLLLGQPDAAHFLLFRNNNHAGVLHSTEYNAESLRILLDSLTCPLHPANLYDATIALEIGPSKSALADYLTPSFNYNALSTLRHNLTC